MFKIRLVLCIILGCILIHYLYPQSECQEQQKILETLNKFKNGVEIGNLEIGKKIAADDFYPFFKNFYKSLADFYSQHETSLLLEIGHQKILKNGLAKVEVYLNPAKNLFVFTFKKEDGIRKICHIEGIRFPLYSIPGLPYKIIYEIPDDQRKWMNADVDLNFKTRVYFYLSKISRCS